MNTEKQRLERLLALARKGQPAPMEPAANEPPFGFSTRVAARWAASPRHSAAADVWERLSWWGSGLAAAACLLVLTFHQPAPEPTGFDLLLGALHVEPSF